MHHHQEKLHVIHFVDSIYLGQLNASYQRDGFGIQQTCEFDTYIGYWKNNKTQGLGLVILENGTIIYANFIRDEIDGLAIFDNGELLRCGVFRNKQIVGVGFQYNYSLKIWKMSRYHKGISIEVVKQEVSDITNSIPKLINVEQSLYFHLYNYLNKTFFPELHLSVVEELPSHACFYGYKNSNGFYGPGVIVANDQIAQAGFYQQGELNGFGFKRTLNPFTYEFGCYSKGRRDGYFLQKKDGSANFYEYRKGILLKNIAYSQKQIVKNQRRYNYNCKDFYSAKNSVPFEEFKNMSLPSQIRMFQQKKNLINKTSDIKSPRTTNLNFPNRNNDYIIKEIKQKSSLQIIRQKMNQYNGLVVTNRRKQSDMGLNRGSRSRSNTKGEIMMEQDDDQIAKQENPFTPQK